MYHKLTTSLKEAIKKSGVIEVSGKAMNRTALGVVDALLTLYPNLTFAELKAMLPDDINPSAPKNYKSLFKPYTQRLYGVVQSGAIRKECEANGLDVTASHFTAEGETFKTADGMEVLVSKSWESSDTETGENDLENLIQHVAQYGVRVVKVEKKEAFNKGSYHLEIIDSALFNAIRQPKKKWKWLWILLTLLTLLGAILFIVTKQN